MKILSTFSFRMMTVFVDNTFEEFVPQMTWASHWFIHKDWSWWAWQGGQELQMEGVAVFQRELRWRCPSGFRYRYCQTRFKWMYDKQQTGLLDAKRWVRVFFHDILTVSRKAHRAFSYDISCKSMPPNGGTWNYKLQALILKWRYLIDDSITQQHGTSGVRIYEVATCPTDLAVEAYRGPSNSNFLP